MKLILTILLYSALCASPLHNPKRSAGPYSDSFSQIALGEVQNSTWSPDLSKKAYTRENDLYVLDMRSGEEKRLSFDGSEVILNGYASWVYYEEIFGRQSNYKAFWWSPDSRKIAFYRFDNSEVPTFPIYSAKGQGGSLNLTRYPKAGQKNPGVKIAIIDLETMTQTWADFDYEKDQYFGTPFWGNDSKELYVQTMPRRQSCLDLYAVDVSTGSKRAVYHEEYPTWVEWIEGMLFTPKGLYMARSFETGWQQIYFLGYDGSLRRLSEGENWSINLLKLDSSYSELWFTAKRDSKLHTSLYKLDKKGRIVALTDPEYMAQNIKFLPDGKSFSVTLSTAAIPPRKYLGSLDKYSLKLIEDQDYIEAQNSPSSRVVKIENEGFDLYGLISYPKGFDMSKKYPVVMQLYGGPGTPYVRDRWGDRDATDKWCWENGIIYIVVDPRSSGENGRRGMDQAFRQMTVIELKDYISWAKWLQSLPYVDGSRIGVEGFSFGGTTTTMLVLRYPEYFRCGIAGGGVYDWCLYDSHYTERFMDTPQANPEGYALASPINFVNTVFKSENKIKPLPGALMLTHGTGDDNVHFQNTLQLIDALQGALYQFELMIYPDAMHGYRGLQREHDLSNSSRFWTKWLLD